MITPNYYIKNIYIYLFFHIHDQVRAQLEKSTNQHEYYSRARYNTLLQQFNLIYMNQPG
jgi:hypothetical protein